MSFQPPDAGGRLSRDFVDRKVAFGLKDKTVFDLTNGIDARQLDLLALLGGELAA